MNHMKKKLLFMSYLGAALLSACSDSSEDIPADGSSFVPKVVFEIKDITPLGGEKDSLFITSSATLSAANLDYAIKPISNVESKSETPWAASFPGAKFGLNDKLFTDLSGKKTAKWEVTTNKPVTTFALIANFNTNTENPVDFTYSYTVYKGDKVVDYAEKTVTVSEMPTIDEIRIVQ